MYKTNKHRITFIWKQYIILVQQQPNTMQRFVFLLFSILKSMIYALILFIVQVSGIYQFIQRTYPKNEVLQSNGATRTRHANSKEFLRMTSIRIE